MRNSNVANRSTKQIPSECKYARYFLTNGWDIWCGDMEHPCRLNFHDTCFEYQPKEKKDNGNK